MVADLLEASNLKVCETLKRKSFKEQCLAPVNAHQKLNC